MKLQGEEVPDREDYQADGKWARDDLMEDLQNIEEECGEMELDLPPI